MNDCKYGHKIKGNVMSLNLLRSPKTPDPDSDMHLHEFRYALLPHKGDLVDSDVIRESYAFNVPLEALAVSPIQEATITKSGSFLEVDQDNIVVEVIKKAIVCRIGEILLAGWTGRMERNW